MRTRRIVWLVAVLAVAVGAATALSQGAAKAPAWIGWVIAGLVAVAALFEDVLGDTIKQRVARNVERVEARDLAIAEIVGLRGELPRVSDATDAHLLGVHRAIPLPDGADSSLSPDLPTYVSRPIDGQLDNLLREKSTHGGFVVVVGESGRGKTRCAFEAINRTLSDWRLLAVTDAPQLAKVVESGTDLSRTVIWLDDFHEMLGPGGLTAGLVRRLLSDHEHPVVMLGTIWRESRDEIVSSVSGDEAGSDGKVILERLCIQVDMPRSFTADELDSMRSLGQFDPRLAEAARSNDGSLSPTQVLAAAPELIRRWETGSSSFGVAVLTAAVDARILGHPDPVGKNVIQALALEQLTGSELAVAGEDWFERAISWACAPVRGMVAPLQPIGLRAGHADAYAISDILVHYAVDRNRTPSDTRKDLLVESSSPDACGVIGFVAMTGVRDTRLAERAFTKAAEEGDVEAMSNLVFLLPIMGKLDEAERWGLRSAQQGHVTGMTNLGALLRFRGKTSDARKWYERAIALGDIAAMHNLANLLSDAGDDGPAKDLYERAAMGGHADAMTNLGLIYDNDGEPESALEWYSKAIDGGSAAARVNRGNIYLAQGNYGEARRDYKAGIRADIPAAMFNMGILVSRTADPKDAREWYVRAAEKGHVPAMVALAALYRAEGDIAGARSWLERGVEEGDVDALSELGDLLLSEGDLVGARYVYEEASKNGLLFGMVGMARVTETEGDEEAALMWLDRAAEQGDKGAIDAARRLRAASAGE